jgi:hypothetical protein
MVALSERDPMSHDDARRLVELLEAAFPQQRIRVATVDLYVLAFADMDFDEVCEAVVELVCTAAVWPCIWLIRETVRRQRARAPRHQTPDRN